MSGFGFFFWRILLGMFVAPIWIVVGFVVGYVRTVFSSPFGFFVFGVGAVFVLPVLIYAVLLFVPMFFSCYFDRYCTFGDFIDAVTIKETSNPRPGGITQTRRSTPTASCSTCGNAMAFTGRVGHKYDHHDGTRRTKYYDSFHCRSCGHRAEIP